MTKHTAWRFVHPDLDIRQDPVHGLPQIRGGLRLTPLQGIALVSGDDSVRQSVLLLLSTRRGERLMLPNYGCDLHRLTFAPNNETTAGLAVHYVRRALIEWEPQVDILTIDAYPDPIYPNQLRILLEYQVRTTGAVEQLDLALDLMGEGS
jgi:phage baseplate assembly protein W